MAIQQERSSTKFRKKVAVCPCVRIHLSAIFFSLLQIASRSGLRTSSETRYLCDYRLAIVVVSKPGTAGGQTCLQITPSAVRRYTVAKATLIPSSLQAKPAMMYSQSMRSESTLLHKMGLLVRVLILMQIGTTYQFFGSACSTFCTKLRNARRKLLFSLPDIILLMLLVACRRQPRRYFPWARTVTQQSRCRPQELQGGVR